MRGAVVSTSLVRGQANMPVRGVGNVCVRVVIECFVCMTVRGMLSAFS